MEMKLEDPKVVDTRKQDHISLAFKSQTEQEDIDKRFFYEPLLSGHPQELKPTQILGKTLKAPIWVSSMTGGTDLAAKINKNLATVCAKYGLGMGLGSCRSILQSNHRFDDFNIRPIIGDDLPMYANLGIAQLEKLIEQKATEQIDKLIYRLNADGLIVHINPMQEWMQPEGDRFKQAPIDVIETYLDNCKHKVIVKEVGQGMGPESLKRLLQLPLAAIDFAAHGGTNFSTIELLRGSTLKREAHLPLAMTGQTADEMVKLTNKIIRDHREDIKCKEVIISGGLKHYLDGYYYMNKLSLKAIYGQASAFLKYAKESLEVLDAYVYEQIEGLKMANAYLKVKGHEEAE